MRCKIRTGAPRGQFPTQLSGILIAGVAELVGALDLGSSGVTRGGSSPPARTNICMASAQRHTNAQRAVGKLVDALDLGSSGVTHQSSNLCMPTKK